MENSYLCGYLKIKGLTEVSVKCKTARKDVCKGFACSWWGGRKPLEIGSGGVEHGVDFTTKQFNSFSLFSACRASAVGLDGSPGSGKFMWHPLRLSRPNLTLQSALGTLPVMLCG